MKKYSPGANIRSDYYSVCGPILSWDELPNRPGDFALCLDCLKNLFLENYDYGHLLKTSEFIKTTRKAITESLRSQILERDGRKCCQCGSEENIQIDHILPFSIGGTTEESNLQCLCKACNSRKRNNNPNPKRES
jgi:hypothetical protein